jgi:hypothetical protein
MEQDPPVLPVAWERINEIWYNHVKGLNPAAYFGIFDVVRLDTVCRGVKILTGVLRLSHAAIELAEAEVAVGDERAHAVLPGEC